MSSLTSTTTTTTSSRNARQAQPMSLHFEPSNSLHTQQSRPSFPRRISARDRRLDEKGGAPLSPEERTHNRTQTPPKLNVPVPVSFGRPSFTSSPTFWLILYFFFNLSLTLYNKSVLVRFPYPYTLTALHALCSTIGSYTAQCRGYFIPANITPRQNMLLMAFSVLYTINIAVSNISLQMVTIPFHQVVRSTTPFFTLLLSVFLLRAKFSSNKMVSLMPVVGGVALATFGDYSFSAAGLLMTLLGTVLAALKTISTNRLQSTPSPPPMNLHSKVPIAPTSSMSLSSFRLTTKLHPLDLLLRMSPLAFIQCVMYAHVSGELDRVRQFSASHMSTPRLIALVVNGAIAFGLNVVSFTANKKTSALTMTVAANVKQVLTILLAVMIFNLRLTPFNASGILLTLIGGGWYGFIEYREKQTKSLHPMSHSTPTNGWAHPEFDYPSNAGSSNWLRRFRFWGTALSSRLSTVQATLGLSPGRIMKEKMTGPNSPTPESGWPQQ